ncbi:nodulation protein NolW [Bradyrhizobium sp. Arg62]|uniref:secretin N-terminal domain-containing protein n=1 Tax=Bradyrhizobium TaxID=374 RepID=UPI001E5AF7EB|nr:MULTISPECIES: secretin N-terminal domain-containing protein [Bradyrhizobium]MCC8939910.1 nodulation protein NolW [Bradyrhizobium ivorense]MCC8949689.1 nodulation protein NolW [Bradyrhizobium brasilense]
MVHILKRVLYVGVFVWLGMVRALGASLSLPSTPYSYTVLDQDLSAALQEFGNNLNIRVNVSAEVKGRIRGRMPDLAPREFLDRLTNLYNLQWYYDGLVLYISAAHEAQSRLVVLNPISLDAFITALDALNISDERYIVKPAPGDGLVLASGPPRFVALVDQTLKGLVAEAHARRNPAAEKSARESILMLFRGSSSMVIRDGRPEGHYSSDTQHVDGAVRDAGPGQK